MKAFLRGGGEKKVTSYIKDSLLAYFCTSKQPLHASPEICFGRVCNQWTREYWTRYWTGLLDSNFNAQKKQTKLLCSPINIYVPVERVAQYTSKIAILLQRGTYLSLHSDVRVSRIMPVFFYMQRPYLNIAATYLNQLSAEIF